MPRIRNPRVHVAPLIPLGDDPRPRARPGSSRRAAGRSPQAAPGRPCEALESRVLLSASFVPAGPEFRVDTPAEGDRPGDTRFSPHAVAASPWGDFFVAVWQGDDPAAATGDDAPGILARRYFRDGTPIGAPFLVNQATGLQRAPSVAMNRNGAFVVAWESYVEGGGQSDVYARIYDRDGVPRGNEFRVNAAGNGSQLQPDVGMDGQGRVVVTWLDSDHVVDNGVAVNFRLFTSSGAPVTGDVTAGSGGTGALLNSVTSVAMEDLSGEFVLAWATRSGSRLHSYIVARQYDDSGRPMLGREAIVVAPEGDSDLVDANVTGDSVGNFVVAWSAGPGTSGDGEVYARPFTSSGTPRAEPVHVNTQTALVQDAPSVAMDVFGRFLVAWETAVSAGDPDSLSISARGFDRDGTPLADEFAVNTTTKGGQVGPGVAMDPRDGDAMIVWTTDDVDEAGQANDGVFARRLRFGMVPPTPTILGRHLFYGEVTNPVIDTTKNALLPGQTASFANVSNDPRGVYGVAIDLANFRPEGDIRLSDFKVRAGDGGDPSTWAAAPSPSAFRAVSNGSGGGTILLHWAAGAVTNKWVQITLPAAPETTGLAQSDVFYFGSLPGETGDNPGRFAVNSIDLAAIKRALNQPAEIGRPVDINHDGRVNALDLSAARANLNRSLAAFTAPAVAAAASGTSAPALAPTPPTALLTGAKDRTGEAAADVLP